MDTLAALQSHLEVVFRRTCAIAETVAVANIQSFQPFARRRLNFAAAVPSW